LSLGLVFSCMTWHLAVGVVMGCGGVGCRGVCSDG
jgi:hypothetical protein